MDEANEEKRPIFEYYSEVKDKEIKWLWYPFIPYGKITLVQGDPGEGKSTFMLNLVALLTRGQNLPDGTKIPHPMNVIYQCIKKMTKNFNQRPPFVRSFLLPCGSV